MTVNIKQVLTSGNNFLHEKLIIFQFFKNSPPIAARKEAKCVPLLCILTK
jgi:hypothetical protein